MQRDIWIKVTYEIDTNNGLKITPIKKVKDMIFDDMLNYFGQDEGYCSLEVEVEDSE